MNGLFLGLLAAAALALAIIWGARLASRRRQARLRAQGYELIFSLKSYSAWVDCQSDEPLMSRDTDKLASPQPLARAGEIREAAFPGLSRHMLRLLQAHCRLIEYLRRHNLLRLSHASGWRPAWQDPHYQQIRGALEDLVQEMIGQCQEMIGDHAQEWRQTGTDFAFSGGMSSTRGAAGA